MDDDEPCKKRKADAAAPVKVEEGNTGMTMQFMERMMQQNTEMEALRVEKEKWKALAGADTDQIEAERSRRSQKDWHDAQMERINADLKMANERADTATKSAKSLHVQLIARDAVIAEKDALLIKASDAHKNMRDEVVRIQKECAELIERKDVGVKILNAKLEIARDAVQQKRVNGASILKISNELHLMFKGLNDVLNKNNYVQKKRGEDGSAAQTPVEVISVAKATLLNELSTEEVKIREDFSGVWSELVNSCISKAQNIDRRCFERGIAAICFLFHKKADPTYVIPAGGFGATAEQVTQRFLEMIGSEQSTWAHMQKTIEEALQKINPP